MALLNGASEGGGSPPPVRAEPIPEDPSAEPECSFSRELSPLFAGSAMAVLPWLGYGFSLPTAALPYLSKLLYAGHKPFIYFVCYAIGLQLPAACITHACITHA